MPSTANTWTFRLLLAVVLLAPLPLGSQRPWAWTLMAVLVGGVLAVWSLLVLTGRARAPVPMARLGGLALAFVPVLVWAFLQILTAMPESWWHPLWAEASAALGMAPEGRISLDPERTLTALMRLACHGGIFWLAVQLGRDRARAREALVAVAVGGTLYAIYGLVVYFSGWERILWLEKWAYRGDLTSTFVNRNVYGAYAGLGAVCCVALFAHALRPRHSGQELRAYDLVETVLVRALPFFLGAVILLTALLLSHSRGAFLSTGLALGVLMAALVAGRVTRPRLAAGLCAALLVAGLAVLALSGDVTVRRLADTVASENEESRADVYRLTGQAILDAPWTGNGLGAFTPAFRVYRDASLTTPVVWDFAHNVHLETAMDLGLPATLLLYGAVLGIVGSCARGLTRRRRDQVYPAVALSAAALLGVHGLVDFSVQIPAVAATLALLLGVGFAQSASSADHARGP